MKLPTSISPCPIREVVAEVRFNSDVPPDAVLGIIYAAVKDLFPKVEELPIASLPTQIRLHDASLKFQPSHRLVGDGRGALVGPRVFAMVWFQPYPGWSKIKGEVEQVAQKVRETRLFDDPVRFGLRYIDFFSLDVFEKLSLELKVAGDSLMGEETSINTLLKTDLCSLTLRIGNSNAMKEDLTKKGSVIDIDAFREVEAVSFDDEFAQFLDSAHARQKKLFYRLLKPEFLTSLNPTY